MLKDRHVSLPATNMHVLQVSRGNPDELTRFADGINDYAVMQRIPFDEFRHTNVLTTQTD